MSADASTSTRAAGSGRTVMGVANALRATTRVIAGAITFTAASESTSAKNSRAELALNPKSGSAKPRASAATRMTSPPPQPLAHADSCRPLSDRGKPPPDGARAIRTLSRSFRGWCSSAALPKRDQEKESSRDAAV
ncbi:MAG: hypothetical protein WDM88_04805 [Galbitalea sp.]